MSLLAALTIVAPVLLTGLAVIAGQARYGWGR